MIVGPLRIKAQLFCGDEGAIGPGKANLLEAIEAQGSISAAGRALGMSYRRTWLLVDEMNRCWVEKLVETTLGGGSSRGARLTALGHQVLAEYRSMERHLVEAAVREVSTLSALLRDRPLPPKAPAD